MILWFWDLLGGTRIKIYIWSEHCRCGMARRAVRRTGTECAALEQWLPLCAAWGWGVFHKCQAGCTLTLKTRTRREKERQVKAQVISGYFSCRGCRFVSCVLHYSAMAARMWHSLKVTGGTGRLFAFQCKGPILLTAGRDLCVSHSLAVYHRAADHLKCWMNKSTPCQLPSVSLAWSPDAS